MLDNINVPNTDIWIEKPIYDDGKWYVDITQYDEETDKIINLGCAVFNIKWYTGKNVYGEYIDCDITLNTKESNNLSIINVYEPYIMAALQKAIQHYIDKHDMHFEWVG
ncbi:MAG: hypothetical protein N3F66_14690 [Spirochaetes bacterium]|nr:hypothetical protein [Spirochaetota bacterium]